MNNYEIMMNGNVKIGEFAPEFEAQTTMGNIKLSDYKGKWVVLFSHPGDFTPVCTTEFIAFSKMNTYFENLNTCLLGLSIDSNASHLAWLYDICMRTGVRVPNYKSYFSISTKYRQMHSLNFKNYRSFAISRF